MSGPHQASGIAGETLNAVQMVQAFTLESYHTERFGAAVAGSFDAAIMRIRARARLTAFAILVVVEFFLHTDHFLLEAIYRIEPLAA